MKKCWMILLLAGLLSGCSAAETFETVGDDLLQPVMAPAGELTMILPDSAALQVLQNENGEKLYFCDGYILTVQTMESGDLEQTARSLCGFGTEGLTVMETACDGVKRWEWAWTAAGEGGDQVGRAVVLDDGSYHYCLTVMAEADQVGELQREWNAILTSVSIGS